MASIPPSHACVYAGRSALRHLALRPITTNGAELRLLSGLAPDLRSFFGPRSEVSYSGPVCVLYTEALYRTRIPAFEFERFHAVNYSAWMELYQFDADTGKPPTTP